MSKRDDNHIIQIIPAPDWYAFYSSRSNEGKMEAIASPLSAWGLTAGGEVVPIDSCNSGETAVATEADNFVRLEHLPD